MKDSLGKEMPKSISLSEKDKDAETLGKALSTNTFLLAAQVAIKKGNTVIYSEENKSADIIDEEGYIWTIEHE